MYFLCFLVKIYAFLAQSCLFAKSYCFFSFYIVCFSLSKHFSVLTKTSLNRGTAAMPLQCLLIERVSISLPPLFFTPTYLRLCFHQERLQQEPLRMYTQPMLSFLDWFQALKVNTAAKHYHLIGVQQLPLFLSHDIVYPLYPFMWVFISVYM